MTLVYGKLTEFENIFFKDAWKIVMKRNVIYEWEN